MVVRQATTKAARACAVGVVLMRPPIDIAPRALLERIRQNLPREILDRPRFALWKLTAEGRKLPLRADRTACASCTDSSTWVSFDAVAAALRGGEGILFALGDGIGGLDLDDALPLSSEGRLFLGHLDSYTEVSPSGTGLHVLFGHTGELASRRRGSVELYFRSRFFTITGDVLEGRRRFRNADIGVRRILAALEPPKPLLPRLPLRDVPQDDALLIEQMFASRRGPTIRRLWSGETLHKSSSESDYALMGDLSYWTGGDVERMIRLFLSSGRAERAKGRRADYLVRMAQKVAV
jgi:putative DNA primase/helicase